MRPEAVERLLQDASIIRNRKKIEACIENAAIVRSIQRQHGTFCNWFYDVLEGDSLASLQSAIRKTFKFMGPEITPDVVDGFGPYPNARVIHDEC